MSIAVASTVGRYNRLELHEPRGRLGLEVWRSRTLRETAVLRVARTALPTIHLQMSERRVQCRGKSSQALGASVPRREPHASNG